MAEAKAVQQRLQQVETLVRKIENLPDPEARASAVELVRSLMEFHGAGLERMMEIVAANETEYPRTFDEFAGDPLVANVLLLYGLHPISLQLRVEQALESVRPYLQKHGGDAELLGIAEGTVRLRLEGNCQGCPSTSATLKQAIETAIYEAAPDVTEIVADGLEESATPAKLVQIGKLARAAAVAD